ncbi:unnamed protein product [Didymodactylos carnosus]|uniref:Uncharacterized protein n=1 Tax=Didymodactylos carnosus TaxID=1234261 RepID=A0A8S2REV6_9BILA|nr:unnamed protein product [Didymodactylos carnosus]CAF4160432.1 unnamed protein product [Didymodactylos carnosus]
MLYLHDILASIRSEKINIFRSALAAAPEQLIHTIKVENNSDYSPLKQLRYMCSFYLFLKLVRRISSSQFCIAGRRRIAQAIAEAEISSDDD